MKRSKLKNLPNKIFVKTIASYIASILLLLLQLAVAIINADTDMFVAALGVCIPTVILLIITGTNMAYAADVRKAQKKLLPELLSMTKEELSLYIKNEQQKLMDDPSMIKSKALKFAQTVETLRFEASS